MTMEKTWEVDRSSIESDYDTVVTVYLTSLAKLNLARSLVNMKLFKSIQPFTRLDADSVDINSYLIERGLSLTIMCKDGNCFLMQ